jgi:hypothetical protein
VRDSLFLRAVKRVALWRYQVDVALHRAWRRARGEQAWILAGGCRRSGACCEAPAISVGRITWALPPARRLFLAWQRRVNGFDLVSTRAGERVFVFRCSHFHSQTRSCDCYASRPGVCRDYPRLLLWQPNPEMLPRCGYRAAPPNAAGLRAAIERLDVTPEQRAKLRRGLRLGD